MKFAGASDIGRLRRSNQDTFLIAEHESVTLIAVCDGMGGANAGEIASDMACVSLKTSFTEAGPMGSDLETLKSWLETAIRQANSEIYRLSLKVPAYAGMGTTLVAAIFTPTATLVANVGDSRAYLLDDTNRLSQITDDHSLVNVLIKQGKLSPEQAKVHPQRSVLTNVLGVQEPVAIDFFPIVKPYKGLLCCSDGLHGMVADEQLERILATKTGLKRKVTQLIHQANANGGADNVTVALAWK